ncbi:hypothetical protein [Caballeronia sp. HLA56]
MLVAAGCKEISDDLIVIGTTDVRVLLSTPKLSRRNACAYVLSAVLVLIIGSGVSDRVWLAVLIFATSTAVTSAVTPMSALAASFYPPRAARRVSRGCSASAAWARSPARWRAA